MASCETGAFIKWVLTGAVGNFIEAKRWYADTML